MTEWIISGADSASWTAVRELQTTLVVVRGRGPFGQVGRDVVAGLVVVPESALPSPPLDGRSPTASGLEQAFVVARYESEGVVHLLSAQESNGYWCIWTDRSGGCGGQRIDPSAVLTFEGASFTVADGASTGRSVLAGSVTPEAVRVEVEYSDGTVVVVSPTDLSGRFDRTFWIAAAEVPSTGRSVEVRAYGADEQLLGTATPPPS